MKNSTLVWPVVVSVALVVVSLAAGVQGGAGGSSGTGGSSAASSASAGGRLQPAPARIVRPHARAVSPRAAAPAGGPVAALAASPDVVYQDDFEGAFPGPWATLYGGPQAWWGSSTQRAFDGTKSVYCAAAGAQAVPPGGPYLANMNAWLVYGPFSLVGATAASATFKAWVKSESGYDYFWWTVSVDDNNYTGYKTSGDSGGWATGTLDFADPALGITVVGQPQVWFAFIFQSDDSTQLEGAYVDAFSIAKTTTTGCTLGCSATVPATAQAGSPVSFQATATPTNCTGTVAYSWNFGDQTATSTEQNPTHTYATPGTYTWQVTASVAGVTCVRSGSITVSGCTLSCSATVPATAQAGSPVSLQATATPTNCTGTVAYSWNFGDQTATSTEQNPTHTYATPGTYTWQVTASVDGQSCVRTGTITISTPTPATYSYWLPVASHAQGLKGSQWRTDLGMLNLTTETADVELRYYGGATALTSDTTVAGGAQSIIKDVVNLFGVSGSGALEVFSDQPLYVTSRTYNQAASGTFGQGYDAFTVAQGLATGQSLYLLELTENPAYRTNIGVTNLDGATVAAAAATTAGRRQVGVAALDNGPATALVELFSGAGTKLGDYTVNLAAGQWKQETQPFKTKAGQTDLASGYARITITQGSGVVAYASVIDNVTNDATTIPMKRGLSVGTQYWLPVASHAQGLKGSQWRTDIGILNLSGVTANMQLKYHGASVPPSVQSVANGAQLLLKDVVNLFGVSGSGALEVLADQQLYVTSRTYNQAASGTFGQEYDSFTPSLGLWTGQLLYLIELSENAAYRCNIGLTNIGQVAAQVLVELFSGAGAKLGEYTVNLAAGEWKQETQPFKNKAGQTNMASGYAKVTVTQGAGVIAYASVIDNVTNDATTIPMKRPYTSAVNTLTSVNWISGKVLGELGAKLPTIDTIVSSIISSGPTQMLNDLAAGDPTHRIVLPDGVKFDYGDGTIIRGSNVTGSVTFTYSNGNRTATGFSADFAGVASPTFAVDGATYPITNLTGTISASQTTTPPPGISAWDLGFFHVRRQAVTQTIGDVTISGSGDNPASTITGNIHFDTAKCPKGYPTAGKIDKTIGGDRYVITFGDSCDGSIGFAVNPPALPCTAGQQVAGGDTPDIRSFEMGTKSATFAFDYETYSIEDQIQVIYEGAVIFDTGCVGTAGSQNVTFSGNSTVIQVKVNPNCKGTTGTAWAYTVHCPQ